MVLLKRFFTGFFPNDPEELPVRTTPSVTQNNASRSWGGAGLSVHEEAVAVLAWSQCQTLLQCMCTYVCTLWCVCMCVDTCACMRVCTCACICVCARGQVSVLLLHTCIPCHLKKQLAGSQLKHSWSAESRSSQLSVCIYRCFHNVKEPFDHSFCSSIEFIKMKRSIMLKL